MKTTIIKYLKPSNLFLIGFLLFPSLAAIAATPELYYAAPRCGYANEVIIRYKDGTGDIDSTTASTTSNFSVSGRTVSSAEYFAVLRATRLTLSSSLSNLGRYNVTVSGVKDSGLTNTMTSTNDIMHYSSSDDRIVGAAWESSTSLSGTPGDVVAATQINEDKSSGESGGLLTALITLITDLLTGLTCWIFSTCTSYSSARWDGFVVPTATGTYTMALDYNERARLWMDNPRHSDTDTKFIDAWTNDLSSINSDATASNTISLTAGEAYPVTVEWAHKAKLSDESQRIKFKWTPPSSSQVVIPSTAFQSCVTESFVDELDSLEISVPTTASACGSASVTVTAVGTLNDPMTSYTGTVTLTTSSGHGTWTTSGSGTFDDGTADDGIATYTFVGADNGVVTFNLENRHADVTSVTVNDSSEGISATSSNITFQHNGIEINQADTNGWDVVAGRDHSFEVEYLVLNQSSTECQTADFSGSVGLKFWLTSNSPAGATVPKISNGTDYSVSTNAASPTTVILSVANGIAGFTLKSTDVGDFQLNVKDDTSGFALDSGGSQITLTGYQTRGKNITVRPFGLYLEVTDNEKATTATGNVFRKAGEAFTYWVHGVAYEGLDDLDNNLIPDGHDVTAVNPASIADLSNNTKLPSFGNEGVSVTSVAKNYLPAGGTDGTLDGTLSYGGANNFSGSFTYDEVGIMQIDAESAATYLNSDQMLYGKSTYVGRFTPDHFDVVFNNTPSLVGWKDRDGNSVNDWTCNFAYIGQPFAFDFNPELLFAAKNAAGSVTENYVGDFNKYTGATGDLVDDVSPTGLVLTETAVVATVNDDEGDGTDDPGIFLLTVTGYDNTGSLTYGKPVAEYEDFEPKFHLAFTAAELTDGDTICYDSGSGCIGLAQANDTITGVDLYYGRVVMQSNFGSGTTDLDLSYRTQAWKSINGTYQYATLTIDSNGCTGTTAADFAETLGTPTEQLNAGETVATIGGLANGLGTITFTAPGITNYGQVGITLTTIPSYLMYDYDDDGTIELGNNDDRPSATASFGLFTGGSNNKFFRRETYR